MDLLALRNHQEAKLPGAVGIQNRYDVIGDNAAGGSLIRHVAFEETILRQCIVRNGRRRRWLAATHQSDQQGKTSLHGVIDGSGACMQSYLETSVEAIKPVSVHMLLTAALRLVKVALPLA